AGPGKSRVSGPGDGETGPVHPGRTRKPRTPVRERPSQTPLTIDGVNSFERVRAESVPLQPAPAPPVPSPFRSSRFLPSSLRPSLEPRLRTAHHGRRGGRATRPHVHVSDS